MDHAMTRRYSVVEYEQPLTILNYTAYTDTAKGFLVWIDKGIMDRC